MSTPPSMPFAYTVFDRPLDKPGGARMPTEAEHAAAPQFAHPIFAGANAPIAPDSSPDWVSAYLAVHWADLQGPTGECVHATANHMYLATALNFQHTVMEHTSVGFSYYTTTGDRTFSLGSGLYEALTKWQEIGNCTNALYSQDWVMAHWHGTGEYSDAELPQPPCYVDAPKHKILRWSVIAFSQPDMNQIKLLLNAGHSIGFFMGRHQVTIDMYVPGWFFGFDSEMVVDQTGHGVGVRAFGEALVESGYGFAYIDEVDLTGGAVIPPPPPQGVNMTAILKGRADWNALTGEPVTQAARDVLVADAMALVLVGGAPPPNPTAYDPKLCYPLLTPGAGQTPPNFVYAPTTNSKRWPLPQGSTLCLDETAAGLSLYTRSGKDGLIPLLNIDGSTDAHVGYAGVFATESARLDAIVTGGVVPPIIPPPPPIVPPPTPAGVILAPSTVQTTDGKGYVWKFGDYKGDPRYGWEILCNDRAIAAGDGIAYNPTTKELKVGMQAPGAAARSWSLFAGDPWTHTFTPTTPP